MIQTEEETADAGLRMMSAVVDTFVTWCSHLGGRCATPKHY